ncbi:hypothetical protein [Herpetosiphon gulosus]|uniref:Uncharacterized protein n=1 Tax=Herpetosiphon gulosus TaxID=1973496 RepID=A0ABP9X903_9CHLR
MPMLKALLDAGMTVEEAYRAVCKEITPAMLANLRWMQQHRPDQVAHYAAEWERAGFPPPWAALLDGWDGAVPTVGGADEPIL